MNILKARIKQFPIWHYKAIFIVEVISTIENDQGKNQSRLLNKNFINNDGYI